MDGIGIRDGLLAASADKTYEWHQAQIRYSSLVLCYSYRNCHIVAVYPLLVFGVTVLYRYLRLRPGAFQSYYNTCKSTRSIIHHFPLGQTFDIY